jgi:hypothetical protein
MPTKKPDPYLDPRPNVFRLTHLAINEILGDKNPDPQEVAHREWLRRRLAEKTHKVAMIPRKLVFRGN